MDFLTITDVDIAEKSVMIRADLNVPLKEGHVTSQARIDAALETIRYAVSQNAKVMVMSHLGRPTEGVYDQQYSLAPVAECLSEKLGQSVELIDDWLSDVAIAPGQVVLLENVRFNKGEKDNNEGLSKKMASLCDVFVMDAFATAHRAHASTYGVAEFAPIACAGMLFQKEIKALTSACENPKRPLAAIVGGAKVSSKLGVLTNLLHKVDLLIIGGGIANTFLAAKGYDIGDSLCEKDLISKAAELLQIAEDNGVNLPLPVDVRVAKTFDDQQSTIRAVESVQPDEMILDVGPTTQQMYAHALGDMNSIVWNGPLGVFEFENFAEGTKAVGQAIAASAGLTVAGGGDTVAAIERFDLVNRIDYISTAGGAFLEFLEGKRLPAIAILNQRYQTMESKNA